MQMQRLGGAVVEMSFLDYRIHSSLRQCAWSSVAEAYPAEGLEKDGNQNPCHDQEDRPKHDLGHSPRGRDGLDLRLIHIVWLHSACDIRSAAA